MAKMDDLYFEFEGPHEADYRVGETYVIEGVPLSGGEPWAIEVAVASRRDFPNSADFFGAASCRGRRYSAQICVNKTLREGDGIILTPLDLG